MSAVVLMTRPDGVQAESFFKELRARAPELAGRAATLRLYLADVDQAPLLGTVTNEARRPSFEAALVIEPDGAFDAESELAAIGRLRAYRTRSRVLAPHAGGEPTPGFTMVSPVYRAANISHAEFDAHWLEQHAPLALRHHPGMWGYEQHVVDEVLTPDATDFDGVALLGFLSTADFTERMFDSDEGRAIIMADTRRVLALARSEAVLMSEHVIKGL